MIKQPEYIFDKDSGISKCIITDKQGHKFIGEAKCHPEDMDMNSRFTGITIAEMRANREVFRHIRDNEIIPELKSLKELYGVMKHSTRFNPQSYENIMLQRMIRQKENELSEVRAMIAAQSKDIRQFLYEKEKCYQGIRRHRAEAAQEQGQNEIK